VSNVIPFPRPNTLRNAQIARAMNDTDIARTVARLCERMDDEERREAKRIETRRAVERDLRGVEARLKVSRSPAERERLMGLMRRARKALGEMER
jgi:hypothetical protein